MSDRVVCESSALVALLLDSGPDGTWATAALAGAELAAPSLARFEASNVIRRLELAEHVSADQAAQAHADLLDLAVEEWPYEVLAARVWDLRTYLSTYDASYVALCEYTNATLVTLDRRIGCAADIQCRVVTPASND